jgi:hypothetical protein
MMHLPMLLSAQSASRHTLLAGLHKVIALTSASQAQRLTEEGVYERDCLQSFAKSHFVCENAACGFHLAQSHHALVHELLSVHSPDYSP